MGKDFGKDFVKGIANAANKQTTINNLKQTIFAATQEIRRRLGAHLTTQQCRDLASLLLQAAADTEADLTVYEGGDGGRYRQLSHQGSPRSSPHACKEHNVNILGKHFL